MKFFLFISVSVSLLFASCKGDDSKETSSQADSTVSESTTTEKVDTVLSNETINFFNQLGFSEFAKGRSAKFDWHKFHMVNSWKEDSMLTSAFNPAKGYYEAYGRFLKYSPDSSMFVDLDSYNIDITKDKQGRWIGIEEGPDTEVSLVTPGKKQKIRLIFLGPGSSVEEALWTDNENVALIGFEEAGSEHKKAVIWRYHLPTSTYFQYELPDPEAASQLMGQWRKERLKGVILK